MNPATGKIIILVGAGLILLGLLIYSFHGHLHWIGRLPGDIRIERENFRFYFPVTTMILASILLTVILWLVRRFLQ